jgi:hypothetical protein
MTKIFIARSINLPEPLVRLLSAVALIRNAATTLQQAHNFQT